MLRDKEWREKDRLMLKEGKVYVSKDEELRTEIIRLHHDTPVGGYGEQWKTVELVTRNFWWPEVTKEVVMTSLVKMTNLSHSTLRENEENSIESLCGLCYLLIHKSYLSMCMFSNY